MNWRKIQLVENLVKSYLVDKDILYTATKYCHPSLLFRQFKFRRKFRNPAAQLFENRNFFHSELRGLFNSHKTRVESTQWSLINRCSLDCAAISRVERGRGTKGEAPFNRATWKWRRVIKPWRQLRTCFQLKNRDDKNINRGVLSEKSIGGENFFIGRCRPNFWSIGRRESTQTWFK